MNKSLIRTEQTSTSRKIANHCAGPFAYGITDEILEIWFNDGLTENRVL